MVTRKLFEDWIATLGEPPSGPSPEVVQKLFVVMNGVDGADAILKQAVAGHWMMSRMLMYLSNKAGISEVTRLVAASRRGLQVVPMAPQSPSSVPEQPRRTFVVAPNGAPQVNDLGAVAVGKPQDTPQGSVASSPSPAQNRPSVTTETAKKPQAKTGFDPKAAALAGFLGRFKKEPSSGQAKASTARQPGGDQGSNKTKMIWIGVAVGVVLLVVAGFFAINLASSSSNDLSYDDGSYGEPQHGTPTVPVLVPHEPDPWFVTAFNGAGKNVEPFLVKPTGLEDFLNKFPWRWILWIFFLLPLWFLLRQDRFAAQERTDVQTALFGILSMFFLVLASGPLSAIIASSFPTWGPTMGFSVDATTQLVIQVIQVISQILFVVVGIAMNFAFQYSASMSGRRDFSALAIAFCFMTGVLLIWWFTNVLLVVIVGAIFMTMGIYLQSIEMNRTHKGNRAVLVAIVMLAIFGLLMWGYYGLAGLLSNVPTNANLAMAILYFVVFKSRLLMGAIFGFVIAYGVSDWLTGWLIQPANADHAVFKGKPVPQHNNGEPRGITPDDFDSKWNVEARYDAMAWAIMLLYFLSPAVYYLLVMFLLIR